MAMITTALLESWPSDYAFLKPAAAGLNVDCYVRWKVFTLPSSLIVKRLGTVAEPDRQAIIARARQVLLPKP